MMVQRRWRKKIIKMIDICRRGEKEERKTNRRKKEGL